MKHTMSMYQTKDAMIEAMQANIDSLETQLADAKKDSEQLDWFIAQDLNLNVNHWFYYDLFKLKFFNTQKTTKLNSFNNFSVRIVAYSHKNHKTKIFAK